MLIELLTLARNLKAQGIDTGLVHRDFDRPGVSSHASLKVILNERGEIARLLPIVKGDEYLWTLKRGNFKYFPAVRPEKPPICLNVDDDEKWSIFENPARFDELSNCIVACDGLLQEINLSGLGDQVQRISQCTFPDELEIVRALNQFASAFKLFASNPKEVAKAISRAVTVALGTSSCDDSLRKLLTIVLVGQRKKKKDQKVEREYKVQLCFDISLPDDPAFSIYTASVRNVVLRALHAEQATEGKSKSSAQCALSGKAMALLSGPFPSWSAPPVISKPLNAYSKFSEAECNFRYHRADSAAFPVAEDVANQVVAALKTITDQPPGTNWRALHNGKFERKQSRLVETKDVLVVFPTIPLEDLRIASLFGPVNADDGRKVFQDEARPVCEVFSRAVGSAVVAPYLVILLIRQISPGQIQLAYSAMPPLDDFVSAIEHWNASGKNLPSRLRVPLPSKKAKSGFGLFKPNLIFPEEVVRLLSQEWIRGGSENVRLESPAIGSVLDLFLRKPGVYMEVAVSLLGTALDRASGLLTRAGHILHCDDFTTFELWRQFISSARSQREPKYPDYALSQTISLIGSLLYIMNSKVENYMSESAFLVGKLLAAMDELHKCYCIAVRQGDIPNALIGNGLLGRASESPARALEELSERSRVYLGWAKSAAVRKDAPESIQIAINSARKVLRIVAPISESLHADSSLDQAMELVQKAHLFLGYLSPILGKEESDELASESQSTDSE
ncbi:MAG: hypothetical protein PHT48_07575 [Dechloromonas sp.]|nr:hypothetical protein [Dechloromonas sp.]